MLFRPPRRRPRRPPAAEPGRAAAAPTLPPAARSGCPAPAPPPAPPPPPAHPATAAPARWVWRAWWLALAAIAGVLVQTLASVPTTAVHVEVFTEHLQFEPDAERELLWDVGGFELEHCLAADGRTVRQALPEGARLSLAGALEVRLEKRQGTPELRIDLQAPSAAGPAGSGPCAAVLGRVVLIDPAGERQALRGDAAVLRLRHAVAPAAAGGWTTPARLLALRGTVRAGQDIAFGVDAVLLSGQVSVYATRRDGLLRGLLDRLGVEPTYLAEVRPLQRGDLLQLWRADEQPAAALGAIRVSAAGVLDAAYAAPAAEASISRLGTAVIAVTPAFWKRFENEPALAGLAALLFFWMNLAPILALFLPPAGPASGGPPA